MCRPSRQLYVMCIDYPREPVITMLHRYFLGDVGRSTSRSRLTICCTEPLYITFEEKVSGGIYKRRDLKEVIRRRYLQEVY